MNVYRLRILVLGLLLAGLAGCATSPRYRDGERLPGRPEPRRESSRVIYGVSSYYGEDFHGKLTANGEVFDMYGLTAAHKTLPLNTIVRVTNLENENSLILRINDRGPFVKGRILDCSYGAALKLGFVGAGTTRVKIEVIELGDDQYMQHKE